MKYHAKERLSVLLAGFLLLAACGENPVSSTPTPEITAQTPRETAAAVPQTTASPQEQTGFGYRTDISELKTGAAKELFLLKNTAYLCTVEDSGGLGLYLLESGSQVKQPETDGRIAAIASDKETLWYCIQGDSGLRMVQAEPEGTSLSEIMLEGTEDLYPGDLAVGGDGYFYLLQANRVEVFNGIGKRVSSLPFSEGQVGRGLLRLENGQVLLNTWTARSDGYEVYYGSVALVNTESIGASLTDQSVAYNVYNGWGSTVLLSGGGNLYTLDTETGEMNALLGWIDCDVDPNRISAAAAAGPECIQVVTGAETGQEKILLSQVPASELEEKTMVSVGLGNMDTEMKNEITAQAVAFNRENERFRVHLVDYSVYGDGQERLIADLSELDLVIGPEAALQDAELTDLSALFDEEVGEGTLTDGVLSALEQDGVVTSLPLYFTVKTLVGAQSLLGDRNGWTPAEFLEVVQGHTDMAVLPFCNAYDTLDALLQTAGGAVQDYTSLLTAASLIPVEDQAIYELPANQTGAPYQSLREGTLLLNEVELRDFMGLKVLRAEGAEGDLVEIGYPADSGNGAMLSMPIRLGISKSSKQPDEAWEFLKVLLQGFDGFLSRQSLGFPVLQSGFTAMAGEAMQGIRYENENGETVEEDPVIWIDGEARKAEPFTQEDVDGFTAYCAGNSGAAGGSDSLRESARSALKAVIEAGEAPADAAKDIVT